jgi:hypothetical protein
VAQIEPGESVRPVVAASLFMRSRMRRESEKWDPDPQSLKLQDPHFFNADPHPCFCRSQRLTVTCWYRRSRAAPAVNAYNGVVVAQMEPWRVCRPVLADSHNFFYEEQDSEGN